MSDDSAAKTADDLPDKLRSRMLTGSCGYAMVPTEWLEQAANEIERLRDETIGRRQILPSAWRRK